MKKRSKKLKIITLRKQTVTWGERKKGSNQNKNKIKHYGRYRKNAKLTPDRIRAKMIRRRNGFIKLLYSLKKRPLWFITLIYPSFIKKNALACRINKDINCLGTALRRLYPKCWFIYTIESSIKSPLHIHLVGRTGTEKPELKKNIKKYWERILGYRKQKYQRVDYLNSPKDSDAIIGYLSARKKRIGLYKVIELIKNKHSYGVINKKNLPVAEPEVYELNEDQFEELKELLLDEVKTTDLSTGKPHKSNQIERILNSGSGYQVLQDDSRMIKMLKSFKPNGE